MRRSGGLIHLVVGELPPGGEAGGRPPVDRGGVRMLARVARAGRETPPPQAQGFLGDANHPRVSRELRRGRKAQPTHSGRTFPRRSRAATDRRGDGGGQPGGVLDVPVKARRGAPHGNQRGRYPETRDEALLAKPVIPYSREKPLGRPAGARTKTDTGGRVEHTEAIGRTMVKELGKPAP